MMKYAVYDKSSADKDGFCTIVELADSADQSDRDPGHIAVDLTPLAIVSTQDDGWMDFYTAYPGGVTTEFRYHPDRGVFQTPSGQIVREVIPVIPAAPIAPITPLQFRTWLLINVGMDDAELTATIDKSPLGETDKKLAHIAIQYALQFERKHPFVSALGAVLGMDDAALDAAWRGAAKL